MREFRDYLVQCVVAEPFRPFVMMLQGGFEISVSHPEAINYGPELDLLVVYDAGQNATVFHSARILALRRMGGFGT